MVRKAIAFLAVLSMAGIFPRAGLTQELKPEAGKRLGYIGAHASGTARTAPSAAQKPAASAAADIGIQLTKSDHTINRWKTDWSPDSKWIAYEEDNDIFIIPSGGGTPINLTDKITGECYAPCFTSDSKGVTFTWWDGLDQSTDEIGTIDIATRAVTSVMDNAGLGVWSHSGRYLAFRSLKGDLYLYDTRGVGTAALTLLAFGDAAFGHIAFNSDDSQIVTTMVDVNGDWRLAGIPSAGGTPKQLTFHAGKQVYPEYSPDGKWIMYSNYDPTADSFQLYALEVSNGKAQPVFDAASGLDYYCGSFSPDGKRFAYLNYIKAISTYELYNAPFPFASTTVSLKVTVPNGGEVWSPGTTQTIRWDGPASAKVEYSTDAGATWILLPALTVTVANQYQWLIPKTINSNRCLVRVSTLDGSSTDMSDAEFTIAPAAAANITVTAPNGGESWDGGTSKNITWTSSGVTNVKLEYSTDNGSTWLNIVASTLASAGTYAWTVPAVSSIQGLVRVSDASNAAVNDVSDRVFTIFSTTVAKITVTIPNGGETWTAGSMQTIKWTSTGVANVKIEYSTDNGTTWALVTATTGAAAGAYSWVPPSTVSSTTCRVRVSAVVNSSTTDMSDGVFSIIPASTAKITVTSPNGGETWTAGTTQTVTWTSTGISAGNVYYSSDGGANWIAIATYIDATKGTYAWAIPASFSGKYLIRVSSATDTSIGDQSDAVFGIGPATGPSITLTAPIGGERWTAGTTQNITWTSSVILGVKIEYSTDNGANWVLVIAQTDAAPGFFAWAIPGTINSANCKVRVSAPQNAAVTDMSDAVFTISSGGGPKITVTAPNGGESWTAGTTQTVKWTSSIVTNVKIEYTINNGTSWVQIVASTPAAAGSFSWAIPAAVNSANCRIRVSDVLSATMNDVSDAVFAIVPAVSARITVTAPNGGEYWTPGSTRSISWTSSGVLNVKIDYSLDNGSTWAAVIANTSASAGAFSWAVPSGITSLNCRIRISDTANTGLSDQSDAVFTIAPAVAATIKVTAPNGGESWNTGSSEKITWTSTGVSLVTIDYSTNGGQDWILVAANVNATTGSYPVTVPAVVSLNCLVRVSDSKTASVSDVSDAKFTMAPAPFIKITSPVGGETWASGAQNSLTFRAIGVKAVSVEFSSDNGVTWKSIVEKVDIASLKVISPAGELIREFSYDFTVPDLAAASSQCLVRVTDVDDTIRRDRSAGTFTVTPGAFLKLASPNGGEQWVTGTTQKIAWTSGGVETVYLEYSDNGGTSWTLIVSDVYAPDGSFDWTVPSVVSSKFKVRITDSKTPTRTDSSDAVFTVAPQPFIKVISPNGGEKFTQNSTQSIVWESAGITNVKIEYSPDGGTTWILISSSTGDTAKKYSWPVPPAVTSTSCMIRITDASNPTRTDMSDGTFTIEPGAFINVTAPNGGERWKQGSYNTITWDSYGVQTVYIEYSEDGGTNWTLVASNIAGDGKNYGWTVPRIISSTCIVRVSDASAPTRNDRSNAVFTIEPESFVKVLTPNSGEKWIQGSTQAVKWDSYGPAKVKIEYSTDYGSSWKSVIASTDASTKSYNWPVPAVTSQGCQIRISDASNPSLLDVSDGYFTIEPGAFITVTSPNGGERWKQGSYNTITWDSYGVANVFIEYSDDGGTTWTTVAASVSGDAKSYGWTVPKIISSTCIVRVSDASAPTRNDRSNAVFTIEPDAYVKVLSPNGGERWTQGSSQSVTWESYGVTSVKIEYSADGSTWKTVFPNASAAAKKYTWTVPTENSTNCMLRISDTSNPSRTDTSDGNFTIVPKSSITLTSPAGGETFYVGQTVKVRWTALEVSRVSIMFSVDGFDTYDLVAEDIDAGLGSFDWSVPDSVSTKGLIAVYDVTDSKIMGMNTTYFSILQPILSLTYPVGGESFKTGDRVTIKWSQTGVTDVTIAYTTDDWANFIYIVQDFDATQGQYAWTVPDLNSTKCLIGIVDNATASNAADFSKNYFTVSRGTQPYLQITSPNGGENWRAGSTQVIRWTSTNSTSVRIEYSTDGGVTWTLAQANATSVANTTNPSFAWTVPNTPSANCKVRVIDTTVTTVGDASDGVFTIQASDVAYISVSSPAAGDRLTVGSKRDIQWQFFGVSGALIELSVDGGVNWEKVVENPSTASSGTYQWAVPDKKSKQCMIRVSDPKATSVFGKSGTFEILQPEIVIGHTPITEARENEKITFTADITGAGNLIVELKYDVTGRRQFDKTKPMTKGNGSTWSCFLDVGVFTAEGIEYTIVARDPDNVGLRATSPDQGYYCIRAQVQTMTSPNKVLAGSVQNSYRLISIPLQLTKSAITEQLERTPDGQMGSDWRLFRFSPGEDNPGEFPNIEGFSPGIAFWLIAKKDFQLKTPEGVAVSTSDPFTITLKPGWNDIANPWMFPISWNDIENPSNANISKPYSYEGGWSNPASGPVVLKSWTGYAVRNMESRNVIIRLLPKQSAGSQKEAAQDTDVLWRLTLAAKAGLAVDDGNELGVRRNASAGWDPSDNVEPPVIGDYVSVMFPHRDWARYPYDYSVDFRPIEGNSSWDFNVRTNIRREKVTVALQGLATLPEGVSVAVLDRDTGKKVSFAGGTFSFTSGDGLTERRFTLVVNGPADPGLDNGPKPAAFVTARAYPNPFNPRTVIHYELSEPGEVVLSVYNAVGQKVVEERLGRRERGAYDYVFDVRNLTSGVYMFRVDAGYSSYTGKMLFMK